MVRITSFNIRSRLLHDGQHRIDWWLGSLWSKLSLVWYYKYPASVMPKHHFSFNNRSRLLHYAQNYFCFNTRRRVGLLLPKVCFFRYLKHASSKMAKPAFTLILEVSCFHLKQNSSSFNIRSYFQYSQNCVCLDIKDRL